MNKLIVDTEEAYEGMMWKNGLKIGYSLTHGLRDFYREWCTQMEVGFYYIG